MTDNLRIWDKVSKTNPAHTKKVNQRGGFTAISAHYQIMAATEAFGPIGIGWGYSNSAPIMLDGIVTVGVTLWFESREYTFGPVWGGADLLDSRGKADSDAPKKASTDGLTKALSQLGFNADVFLGRFDDNKYVAEMECEFAAKPEAVATVSDEQWAVLTTLISEAGMDIKFVCESYKIDSLKALPAAKYTALKGRLQQAIQDNSTPQQKAA